MPGDVCKPLKVNVTGHSAPPVALAGLQVTDVHDKPADTGSSNSAPSAAAGPRLVTVKT